MGLTRKQEALRGREVIDMTNEELVLWIEACDLMEVTVKPNKARRSWKRGGEVGRAELARREKKQP